MLLKWIVPAALSLTATGWSQQQSAAKPESQPSCKPEIISTMSLELAQQIIQDMGFQPKRDKDKDGKPEDFLIFRMEGYKVAASVPTPDYIFLGNIFTSKVSLDIVNDWNYTNSFSRAAVGTDDKNLYLVSEIVVHGGVTRDYIEEQITTFRNSLARWARYVMDHEKPSTPETSQ